MVSDLIKAKFKMAFGQKTDLGIKEIRYKECQDCGIKIWLKEHVVIFDGDRCEMVEIYQNICPKCKKVIKEEAKRGGMR